MEGISPQMRSGPAVRFSQYLAEIQSTDTTVKRKIKHARSDWLRSNERHAVPALLFTRLVFARVRRQTRFGQRIAPPSVFEFNCTDKHRLHCATGFLSAPHLCFDVPLPEIKATRVSIAPQELKQQHLGGFLPSTVVSHPACLFVVVASA